MDYEVRGTWVQSARQANLDTSQSFTVCLHSIPSTWNYGENQEVRYTPETEAHICNPSTWEAEPGRSLVESHLGLQYELWVQPRLQCESEARISYWRKSCFRKEGGRVGERKDSYLAHSRCLIHTHWLLFLSLDSFPPLFYKSSNFWKTIKKIVYVLVFRGQWKYRLCRMEVFENR